MIQTESFHFIILNNVKLPLGLNDTKKLPEVTSLKRSTVRMLFGQIYYNADVREKRRGFSTNNALIC